MASVGIHPPKTPVHAGSLGIAKATLPNVCKMPGPPAPFVPSPLPNIAKSGTSPKGYSKSVKIEGKAVAIRGAMFESMGDIASKGTGGGLLSANTHGPAKFITPGSLTVKIEGKSVHLLGEPMLNNCGPSGTPPNTGATLAGLDQATAKKIDDAFKLLCKEFCAEVGNWQSSRKLEQRLLKDPALAKKGLQFPPESARPHMFNGVARTTIPDAALIVNGKIVQCFDFKGPGDRWRNDQKARQTRLARRVPKEVSRKTCGC
ncbi:MAG TPA: PAAR-like domain-containing protein [Polyangiaceae bacterium]